MALQKMRTDDIDGTPGAERTTIEVNGDRCTIDLAAPNRKLLREALNPYFEHGRITPAKQKRTDLAAVKAWATQNGYEIPPRGRIPTAVLEAYDEKNSQ